MTTANNEPKPKNLDDVLREAEKAARSVVWADENKPVTENSTIRIHIYEDGLPRRTQTATEELRDFLQTWKESCLSVRDENAEPWQLDDLDRLRDDATDQLTEIADGNTPVYTREIDQIMFDHGDEIEEAFDDAGFDKDEKWPCGWQAAAICTYINSELRRELDDWLDEEEDRIEEKESESS